MINKSVKSATIQGWDILRGVNVFVTLCCDYKVAFSEDGSFQTSESKIYCVAKEEQKEVKVYSTAVLMPAHDVAEKFLSGTSPVKENRNYLVLRAVNAEGKSKNTCILKVDEEFYVQELLNWARNVALIEECSL